MIIPNWIFGDGGPQPADGIHFPFPRGSRGISLTSDSFSISGRADARVKREPGFYWMPPTGVTDLLATAIWQLDFTFTAPDYLPEDLNCTESKTWAAGTNRVILETDETTDEVSNLPGWSSFSQALAGTRFPKPSPDEDEYQTLSGLGGLIFDRYIDTEDGLHRLYVECLIAGARPAFYADREPDSTGPSKWTDGDGLNPVWVFDIRFVGRAYFNYDITFGSTPSLQTTIGIYDGDEIGRVNTSHADNDDAFEIDLTAVSQFTTF
jgi:hypothetical protein